MRKLTKSASLLLIVVASAMIMDAWNESRAQTGPVVPTQPGQAMGQPPQTVGGVAVVVGVDQPDNCLRIRSGPGSSYEVIGCAPLGQELNITGVWTSNNWAQLSDNGWVYGPQIQTDLRPPEGALAQAPIVAEDQYVEYPVTYAPDPYYLPDYGYSTYWLGGIPLFLYNVDVWRRYHPWWWWKNGHGAWARGHYDRWSPYLRNGAHGNFVHNRAGFSPANVNRFNTRGFTANPRNVVRPGQSFARPNAVRSFSGSNVIRGGTNFNARSINRIGSPVSRGIHLGSGRSFNAARSFNVGRSMNVGRSFSGGFRNAAHFGGGGRRR